jgi:hypothetical protein
MQNVEIGSKRSLILIIDKNVQSSSFNGAEVSWIELIKLKFNEFGMYANLFLLIHISMSVMSLT